uniref:Uncharacterized protein n=1 Tax=viral metagenome TaxID=1070528 RepID=A0A6H2A0C1_9ZZZZ
MAIIKWEYGKWDNIMGYICGQCGKVLPFYQGGLAHEELIDENGGYCPDVPDGEPLEEEP